MPSSATTTSPFGTPPIVSTELVLARSEYFVDVQLWPLTSKLNPIGWPSNFTPEESHHATHLLNSFHYYNERLTDELFAASFHSISNHLWSQASGSRSTWRTFVDTCVITYVEGERPNASDSGLTFARKARQLIGISEENILSPTEALWQAVNHPERAIIFVDDFVGSGNQFSETWRRKRSLPDGVNTSFSSLAQLRGGQFIFCPLICTETGLKVIKGRCRDVLVFPAQILTLRDSALANTSCLWPAHLKSTALRFVRNASIRAGIPQHGEHGWRGFHRLSLTVAFAHSVPDATLPIFYWEQNGWVPLIRKS